MKRLSFIVSLTNDDNDYQQEQATAAEKAGRRLGVDVKIIHAGNDALAQSQQLLHYVQDASAARPDAIMFEPAGGTAFPQVARAAAAAGIGWVVLNHEADYIGDLRRQFKVPVFAISTDHEAVGRIQGQQFGALLPGGGSILYIEGPANSSAAKERTAGMYKTKPATIHVKTMRANWTEESAYKTVSSWLRLRTSQESHIDLVGAQDDSMAMGARKAFSEIAEDERARWMKIPITGCDGMPKTGQTWVRNGTLAATIFIRPNADLAIEMMVEAFKNGAMLPEVKLTDAESVPSLVELSAKGKMTRSAKA
ncbi:MAG TPA: sugar ABC transporter substrate-binding protein [Candidatus Sulfotelmatobacter sp.]|jgi:ribose transport system substrate-binding protein|nr:sugar ABC transporter substrate-binding protein [Candidatus Sulfotelmatobacter sp.]